MKRISWSPHRFFLFQQFIHPDICYHGPFEQSEPWALGSILSVMCKPYSTAPRFIANYTPANTANPTL